MKHKSIFWPLTLVAAGVVWLLVSMRIVPASNLLALVYLFPYLLMALGFGLILRSRWQLAEVIVPALAVTAAIAAIVFAPQLGWTTVPVFGGNQASRAESQARGRCLWKRAKWESSPESKSTIPPKSSSCKVKPNP